MNIGEKITSYKEKLNFRDYKEFSMAAGVNNSWLLELSKKSDIQMIDIHNLVKLSDYLNIDIRQLVIDDEVVETDIMDQIKYIDESCDDISTLINELILLMDKDNIKIDGCLLTDGAKLICKDALKVVKDLTKQHL